MPEVEHPPDVLPIGIGCHMETPRMLRLREGYMKENPQVRQVIGPTARDMERWDTVPVEGADIADGQSEL